MAIPTQEQLAREWTESCATGRPHYARGRTLRATGWTIEGFSGWGRSDAIAEYLPRGRRRARPLFLLTGDRWQSPGWGHSDVQTVVRWAISRVASGAGADVAIVPFSALDAANVDRRTVRLLGSRPDESWTEERTAAEFRHVPIHERTLRRTEERTAETLDDAVARGHQRNSYRLDPATGRHVWGHTPPDDDGIYRWTVSVPYNRPRDDDGLYRWTVHRHRLGDSVFTADVVESVQRSREWTVRDVVRSAAEFVSLEGYENRAYRPSGELPPATAGRRLEELELAPIVETVQVRRRRRFVSSFDTNEPWPSYFLATLPSSSRAESVDSALEDLAPAAVHAALARGRNVIRQGDIFAIATDLSDDDVYGMARSRARLTLFTRSAAPKAGEPGAYVPLPSTTWRKVRREARRLFRESTAARLNRTGPTSAPGARAKYATARAELARIIDHHRTSARAAVLRGDGRGAANHRSHLAMYSGRILATRASARDAYRSDGRAARDRLNECYRVAMTRYDRRPAPEDRRNVIRAALRVHGTTHTATEVVQGPGGTVYLRGIMRHVPGLDPSRRGGRDHVDVRLGSGAEWYLAVRNTVPRNRTAGG
jgi:hypothetical protein